MIQIGKEYYYYAKIYVIIFIEFKIIFKKEQAINFNLIFKNHIYLISKLYSIYILKNFI